jgi:hypothetical protein
VALGFIEAEWKITQEAGDQGMFVEIQGNALRTIR